MDVSFDVVWLGRGGQGAVTAAMLLAQAAVNKGLYALAIPFFGAERRGAPVFAYNRISEKTLHVRSRVEKGDVVAVLDSSLLGMYSLERFVKPGGSVVVNATERGRAAGNFKEYCLDAVEIAEDLGLKVAGWALVNMPVLGAVARVSGLIGELELEAAVKELIRAHVDKNIEAVRRGWSSVRPC
ncbi:2-oxoacid:acceptor oxidoreductase family protein [Infirmifilum lucidum]|uniref:pyruvate synthase n=1 Tax=Infirmifilum lucidum TaxID=2776706 RepID=A0A7L9FFF9_9CREN|nr:2-oxoacid:acceptor oxidoreductase family protein [Infirmifilum lucidum]QOJ78112.1 2-oxoacid:acceptor oxidoreductase family protein [Infirmifilum lucidum]